MLPIVIIIGIVLVALGVLAYLYHVGVFSSLIAHNQQHIAAVENTTKAALTEMSTLAQNVATAAQNTVSNVTKN